MFGAVEGGWRGIPTVFQLLLNSSLILEMSPVPLDLEASQPISNACLSHWVALAGLRSGQEGGREKGRELWSQGNQGPKRKRDPDRAKAKRL